MHRAYSLITIKAIDEEQRTIEGVATTPVTDRMDDIVEPLGAKFTLPLPFMWQHGRDPFVGKTPVGHLVAATPTADGIPVRVQMARTTEPGRLKEILDFAWQAIRDRLVRGLSIGFRPLKDPEEIKGSWGLRFTEWEWLELSAVTIAANADASITTIKSIVESLTTSAPTRPAASGQADRSLVSHSPGATGRSTPRGARVAMKTYTDRIKGFEAEKAAKIARQNELMGADDGTTLDAAGQEEFDTLQKDIDAIAEHMARLDRLEETNKALAKPVNGKTPEEGAASRAHTPVVTVRANREPGTGFARVVICRLLGFLNSTSPIEIAKLRYPDDLAVEYYLKAAVGAATSTGATNAAPLAYMQDLPGEFIAFVRPLTIIGRMPGLRGVPFNVRMVGQTSGGSAAWVGEAHPKPLTKFDFVQHTLGIAKLASIAVISDELAILSRPDAETVVRDSLAGAVVQKQDHDFIDPAITEIANIRPASITQDVAGLPSAGTSADNVRKDLATLFGTFVVANVDPTTAVLIMPNTLCLALSILVNALGQPEFPGMSIKGGTLNGVPVVGSQQATLAPAPGGPGNIVILANAGDIFLADDGSVAIDVNRYGSLEMSDAPTQDGSAGTGAAQVSLWQNNLLGIRAERHINWKKRRPEAVAWLTDVKWGQ